MKDTLVTTPKRGGGRGGTRLILQRTIRKKPGGKRKCPAVPHQQSKKKLVFKFNGSRYGGTGLSSDNVSDIVPTSSISFVEQTESKQVKPLPHIVYRPKVSEYWEKIHPFEQERLESYFKTNLALTPTAGVLVLSGNTNMMSSYVLNVSRPPRTRESLFSILSPSEQLTPHTQLSLSLSEMEQYLGFDRFLCLNYHYDMANATGESAEDGGGAFSRLNPTKHLNEDSNIQVVILFKKAAASSYDSNSKGSGQHGNNDQDVGPNTTRTAAQPKFVCKIRAELFLAKDFYHKASSKLKSKLLFFIHWVERSLSIKLSKRNKTCEHLPLSKPVPWRFVPSRDAFTYKLGWTDVIIPLSNKFLIKRQYFFEGKVPKNYNIEMYKDRKGRCPVGITTYKCVYSNDELKAMEADIDITLEKISQNKLLPNTYHELRKRSHLTRTKIFFNARYLWTKGQKQNRSLAMRAQGIRVDVNKSPAWLVEKLETPLVKSKIIPEGFVNSHACNVYHDGSDGLGPHFDDRERFAQPIISLRLFSDCRLCFDSKGWIGLDSGFFIPMARGDVTVMEPNQYAVTDVKHCVRATDMTGKSAVLLLRHIHKNLLKDAWDIHADDLGRALSAMNFSEGKWKVSAARHAFAPRQTFRTKDAEGVSVETIVSGILSDCVKHVKLKQKIIPAYSIFKTIQNIQRRRISMCSQVNQEATQGRRQVGTRRHWQGNFTCKYNCGHRDYRKNILVHEKSCSDTKACLNMMVKCIEEERQHASDVIGSMLESMVAAVSSNARRSKGCMPIKKSWLRSKRQGNFTCKYNCGHRDYRKNILVHEKSCSDTKACLNMMVQCIEEERQHASDAIGSMLESIVAAVSSNARRSRWPKPKKRKRAGIAAPKKGLFDCDNCCGYQGTYTQVLKHESSCLQEKRVTIPKTVISVVKRLISTVVKRSTLGLKESKKRKLPKTGSMVRVKFRKTAHKKLLRKIEYISKVLLSPNDKVGAEIMLKPAQKGIGSGKMYQVVNRDRGVDLSVGDTLWSVADSCGEEKKGSKKVTKIIMAKGKSLKSAFNKLVQCRPIVVTFCRMKGW